ncbi:MAG: ribosome-binding factor A [Candidatus Harrisonbacteria bacterium RIFCSPHIGHO2_01_FULL_44_13]|uniref:Ribosome-binding factor A n=1 Tax=Candidatus Harrisonbacteria bacterium RIFCSPLOWO2_01_FULL_44_18 TaxID=1798407 RepID=A0A1G1ZNK9_9BACT|nr:MAG: ribosome-binding factor A [Candidatus Harrisonbacteria bacterium RIFCSPHIGHO2_01_FULL_44_13]OGY66152.1 MAG: ribosome-binding factor A [Candidatus Harrisonbacteria bacterium RIFCSPLOWO2_01_FULL_44_18]
MKYFRAQRVSSLIRDELNKLLLRYVEIPEALTTITDVAVSKDLDRAVVKFSVLPSEKAERVLKILNKARGNLQYRLLRKINIKPMPQIAFEIDYGPTKAASIEKALMNE